MNSRIAHKRTPLALLVVLLAACGGSDGADPPAPPAPIGDLTCGLTDFQAEALQRVNQHRAAGASCGSRGSFPSAPPLAWHDRLNAAAYVHSFDMAEHDYFSHTGRDGSSVAERASAAGYAWRAIGENLAGGPRSVAEVVAGWMASDGHCANIMNATFVHIGLACVARSGTTYNRYWTMTLGTPQ